MAPDLVATEVRIRFAKNHADPRLRGFADVVLNEKMCVRSLKIVELRGQLRVFWPDRRNRHGHISVVRVVDPLARARLREQILCVYRKVRSRTVLRESGGAA